MSAIQRFLKVVFVCFVLSSTAILGYLVYQQDKKITALQNKNENLVVMADVERLVDKKIAQIEFPAASHTATTIIQKVAAPLSSPKPQPKEFIVTLGGGAITETDKWVDIPSAQASINSENYPGLKAVYFEVVMHIPNAQGEVRAKLVETTLPFYYGEILKTQSGTDVTLSTPMFLQPGNRNYRVQLYNQIGTAVLDSARIRIVTE